MDHDRDLLIPARVHKHSETLMTQVTEDATDDEGPDESVYLIPAGLVDDWTLAHETLTALGDLIVAYAEGAVTASTSLPAGAHRIVAGDPRYCWNPARHLPHQFRYEIGGHPGVYNCSGDGTAAATALGMSA